MPREPFKRIFEFKIGCFSIHSFASSEVSKQRYFLFIVLKSFFKFSANVEIEAGKNPNVSINLISNFTSRINSLPFLSLIL